MLIVIRSVKPITPREDATMKKSFAPKSVSDSGKADDDDDGLVSAFNLTLTRDFSSQARRKYMSVTFFVTDTCFYFN